MDLDLVTAVIGLTAAILGGGGGAYLTGQQMTLAASRRSDRKVILDLLLPQLTARVDAVSEETMERFPIIRVQSERGDVEPWIAIFWVIGDIVFRTGWRDRRQFAKLRKTFEAAGINMKRYAYPRKYVGEPPPGAHSSTFDSESDESLQLFLYGCDEFGGYMARTFDPRLERFLRLANHHRIMRRSRPKKIRRAAALSRRRRTW